MAHSGPTAEGSFVQTLTLTDIATGWTECAPLLVREQKLLTEVLNEVRKRMPFALLGFDADNDSVFMNAACFGGALEFVAQQHKKNASGSIVTCDTSVGAVRMHVKVPNLPTAEAALFVLISTA